MSVRNIGTVFCGSLNKFKVLACESRETQWIVPYDVGHNEAILHKVVIKERRDRLALMNSHANASEWIHDDHGVECQFSSCSSVAVVALPLSRKTFGIPPP